MQSTSATYNPYPDVRRSDLRVSFRLIDNTAAADATPSSSVSESMSQIAQTHDGIELITAKYATLETHGWPLDGSCEIMPDSVAGIQTGWWSGVSDEAGAFSPVPTLTFAFASDHSSVGFTLIFDDKTTSTPNG